MKQYTLIIKSIFLSIAIIISQTTITMDYSVLIPTIATGLTIGASELYTNTGIVPNLIKRINRFRDFYAWNEFFKSICSYNAQFPEDYQIGNISKETKEGLLDSLQTLSQTEKANAGLIALITNNSRAFRYLLEKNIITTDMIPSVSTTNKSLLELAFLRDSSISSPSKEIQYFCSQYASVKEIQKIISVPYIYQTKYIPMIYYLLESREESLTQLIGAKPECFLDAIETCPYPAGYKRAAKG